MMPKNQKIVLFWEKEGYHFGEFCNDWINKGYVIHQVINVGKSIYLLLYKYVSFEND
jgi:hypothetical protein